MSHFQALQFILAHREPLCTRRIRVTPLTTASSSPNTCHSSAWLRHFRADSISCTGSWRDTLMTIKKTHTNPRAIQVSGPREKHNVPSSSQNNGPEEQTHRGQGAPITRVNCFPPPGREGEDPSRLISMLMIKGRLLKRLLLCNDCIYVFQRNKQSPPRQTDYPRNRGQHSPGMEYQFLTSTMASEGA